MDINWSAKLDTMRFFESFLESIDINEEEITPDCNMLMYAMMNSDFSEEHIAAILSHGADVRRHTKYIPNLLHFGVYRDCSEDILMWVMAADMSCLEEKDYSGQSALDLINDKAEDNPTYATNLFLTAIFLRANDVQKKPLPVQSKLLISVLRENKWLVEAMEHYVVGRGVCLYSYVYTVTFAPLLTDFSPLRDVRLDRILAFDKNTNCNAYARMVKVAQMYAVVHARMAHVHMRTDDAVLGSKHLNYVFRYLDFTSLLNVVLASDVSGMLCRALGSAVKDLAPVEEMSLGICLKNVWEDVFHE